MCCFQKSVTKMAEASDTEKSKVLCRYFVHGVCRQGSQCQFSHDRNTKMNMVCQYYLKGCCSFADRCRYDHVKPKSNHLDHHPVKTTPIHKLTPPSLRTDTPPSSNMVSLKRGGSTSSTGQTPPTPKPPDQWVQAKEFVPGQPYFSPSIPASYAHAAGSSTDLEGEQQVPDTAPTPPANSKELLCPYSHNKPCPYGEECAYSHGEVCELCGQAVLLPGNTGQNEEHKKPCPYGNECAYSHGEVCELCGQALLLPGNTEQNEEHKKECLRQHEHDMELSFAIANSKDKQCGICMDIVMEKEPPIERRFGIMSDCSHCFCLACIRKWRGSKQFDNKTIRSCPECRVSSDFITPSNYWVDTKEEKIKVIQGYKTALGGKPCKYFDQGRGECPFNDKCFYRHAYPDGRIASPKPRRVRRRQDASGEMRTEDRTFLWDFISDRQNRFEEWLLLLEDDLLSLILDISSDSDVDSDDDENISMFF